MHTNINGPAPPFDHFTRSCACEYSVVSRPNGQESEQSLFGVVGRGWVAGCFWLRNERKSAQSSANHCAEHKARNIKHLDFFSVIIVSTRQRWRRAHLKSICGGVSSCVSIALSLLTKFDLKFAYGNRRKLCIGSLYRNTVTVCSSFVCATASIDRSITQQWHYCVLDLRVDLCVCLFLLLLRVVCLDVMCLRPCVH